MAERRRPLEIDDGQGELFSGDAFVPTEVPAHDELVRGEELAALEQATVAADAVRSPHKPRVPLAGPTLDDVMSRVWEGLAMGLPAACPVCEGKIVPSAQGRLHGRCASCGTTIE